MGRIFIITVLGAAIFGVGAWYLGLFEPANLPAGGAGQSAAVAKEDELGADLYTAAPPVPFKLPRSRAVDPITIQGNMVCKEIEEIPSVIPGRVLFVGEEVDSDIAPLAGSTAFIAEPYYVATIHRKPEDVIMYYRALYDGQPLRQGQMVAMIESSKAISTVLEKAAKVKAAEAEEKAAAASEKEAETRWEINKGLFARGSCSKEDLRTSELTFEVKKYERVTKNAAVNLARIEKESADSELTQHEIRPLLPSNSAIKTIVRPRGFSVKQADQVVMIVQNLERLQAEALIEQPYFARLNKQGIFKATIEPSIMEAPLHELPGHFKDVTSVAVAKDMKIVSGSDDGTVCVWTMDSRAPSRRLEHDDAVLAVACTPVGARENVCISGCQDGSITIWNLDDKGREPLAKIPAAHGKDVAITSLAFSPDGASFASGASDGSIKVWTLHGQTNDGADKYGLEKYPFLPEHGVAQCHEDSVTSLHFTPQCRLVSAGRDNTLRVWKLKEKGAVEDRQALRFRDGSVGNLGVSNDGKWMLFDRDRGRTLQLLSVETHQQVHAINTPANSTPFNTLAIFSPDGSLVLTAGAPEGRLQLWRTPDESERGFEVRQFGAKTREPVTCAAFSPDAGKGGPNSFAVSAIGQNVYVWAVPSQIEVNEYRIQNVPLTLKNHNVDSATNQIRIGFEVMNPASERYPNGRFEVGRPVTIVID